MSARKIPLIVNSTAGFALRGASAESLAQTLAEHGVACEVENPEPAALARCVVAARDAGHPVVAVAGGDGSLHTAANILAGSETALAPIPRGTFNHFARRLGLDTPEAAAQAIAGGTVRPVALGIVDHRLFLNTATFGVYAHLLRRRERYRSWLTKWPAAMLAYAMSLRRLQKLEVVLDIEGERLVRRTPLIWVGVGWGSFPRVHEAAERRASPDLELALLRENRVLGLIGLTFRLAFHMLRGEHPVRDPALEVIHTRAFLLRARKPVDVTLDGETLRVAAPIFVSVQDDALQVITAPESDD